MYSEDLMICLTAQNGREKKRVWTRKSNVSRYLCTMHIADDNTHINKMCLSQKLRRECVCYLSDAGNDRVCAQTDRVLITKTILSDSYILYCVPNGSFEGYISSANAFALSKNVKCDDSHHTRQ